MIKTEYAALYPMTFDGHEWMTHGPVSRDDAEQFIRFVNNRAERSGYARRAYLVERTVTYTEWERVPVEQPARGGVTG